MSPTTQERIELGMAKNQAVMWMSNTFKMDLSDKTFGQIYKAKVLHLYKLNQELNAEVFKE